MSGFDTIPVLRAAFHCAGAEAQPDDRVASLSEEFSRLLRATGLRSPRLGHLRYKPRVSLIARISEPVPGPGGAVDQPWWLAVYSADQRDKVDKLLLRAESSGVPLLRAELAELSGAQALAGPIPMDRRLFGPLAKGGLVTADGHLRGSVLSYNPWRRVVLRLSADGTDGERVRRVWAQEPRTTGVLPLLREQGVPVLPVRAVRGGIEQPWLPGGDLAGGPSFEPRLLESLGAALARLHGAAVAADELPILDPVAALADVRSGLGAIAPEHLEEFSGARRAVLAALEGTGAALSRSDTSALDAAGNVPLHGDFSADQVVLDADGEPVLIDLDRLCWGPVGYDLGGFAAFELLAGRPLTAALQLAEVHAADPRVGDRGQVERLGAWTGLHVLLRVLEPFRRLSPDCSAQIRERIALARRLAVGADALGEVSTGA